MSMALKVLAELAEVLAKLKLEVEKVQAELEEVQAKLKEVQAKPEEVQAELKKLQAELEEVLAELKKLSKAELEKSFKVYLIKNPPQGTSHLDLDRKGFKLDDGGKTFVFFLRHEKEGISQLMLCENTDTQCEGNIFAVTFKINGIVMEYGDMDHFS